MAEGNGISLHDVNGDNFTIGDWILCGGETTGWIHIDIADGSGGGGGGAQRLDDLLDVTIGGVNPVDVNLDPNIQPRVALQDGDILRYYSDIGQWVNAPERAGVEMGAALQLLPHQGRCGGIPIPVGCSSATTTATRFSGCWQHLKQVVGQPVVAVVVLLVA